VLGDIGTASPWRAALDNLTAQRFVYPYAEASPERVERGRAG